MKIFTHYKFHIDPQNIAIKSQKLYEEMDCEVDFYGDCNKSSWAQCNCMYFRGFKTYNMKLSI